VETNIEETWTYCRLPIPHHKHFKSTKLLERFNQEIKRRTLGAHLFRRSQLHAADPRRGRRTALRMAGGNPRQSII